MMEDKTARFWIRIFGYMLLVSSLNFVIIGFSMIITTFSFTIKQFALFHIAAKDTAIFLLKDTIIPLCYLVSSSLILFGGIGLLMLKNWGKILTLVVLPLFFIVNRSSLIPVVYVILIYFFTRQRVKEQFYRSSKKLKL